MAYYTSSSLSQRKRSSESAMPSFSPTKKHRPFDELNKGTMTFAYSYLVVGDSCVRYVFDSMCSLLTQNCHPTDMFKIEKPGYRSEEIIKEIEKELQSTVVVDGQNYNKYSAEPTVILVAGNCDLFDRNNQPLMVYSLTAQQHGCSILTKIIESKARLSLNNKRVKFLVLPALPRKFEQMPTEDLIGAFNHGLFTFPATYSIPDVRVLQRVEDIIQNFPINELIDDNQHPTRKFGQYIAELILWSLDFKLKSFSKSTAAGSDSPIPHEFLVNEIDQMNLNDDQN